MRVLRDAEFVDGGPHGRRIELRILRKHVLPHLVPALLVWAAIAVAVNILLEVGISFIGVGVQASTPTWGSLLSVTWGTVYQPQTYNALIYTPWQTLLPTLAILLAVVSLNQLSEGFRRALEPWSTMNGGKLAFVRPPPGRRRVRGLGDGHDHLLHLLGHPDRAGHVRLPERLSTSPTSRSNTPTTCSASTGRC